MQGNLQINREDIFMEILEIAKKRSSIRNYEDRKVEKEKVDKIVEMAHVAPSAANLQPVRLIVIQEESGLQKIAKGANIFHAPLAIIVCSDHRKAWKRPFDGKTTVDIDASIVCDHMMLAATELELGTLWVCYFKPDVIKKEFQLPEHLEPIHILAIGYSNETNANPNRHDQTRIPIDTLVSYEGL